MIPLLYQLSYSAREGPVHIRSASGKVKALAMSRAAA